MDDHLHDEIVVLRAELKRRENEYTDLKKKYEFSLELNKSFTNDLERTTRLLASEKEVADECRVKYQKSVDEILRLKHLLGEK